MKIRDLGPFAVFRHGGRVYVKSGGMFQMLDRSGQYFEPGTHRPDGDEVVDRVNLTAPLTTPGGVPTCFTCYGSGYDPGKYDDLMHGQRKRCPRGCPVEGHVEPEVTSEVGPAVCECCHRPLAGCEAAAATSAG